MEAIAVGRIERTVHAEGVVRSGTCPPRRYQAVPHIAGAPGEIVACGFGTARGVEQAHLDAGRVAGEQGEVDAVLVPRCAQRPWRTCVNDFQITGLTDPMRLGPSRMLWSLQKQPLF